MKREPRKESEETVSEKAYVIASSVGDRLEGELYRAGAAAVGVGENDAVALGVRVDD